MTGGTQYPAASLGLVDADVYAIVVGLGVAMPLLLAGAYPALTRIERARPRALWTAAESVIAVGVGVVTLLRTGYVAPMLRVGGGAAATYLGGTVARALVLGREAVAEEST